MADKSQRKSTNAKKAPEKSLKEKRADKKSKSGASNENAPIGQSRKK